MKNVKMLSLALACLLLILVCPALAEPAPSYDVVYTQANPIPEIARNVRPAVAQVVTRVVMWSPETGEVRQDLASGSAVYIDDRGYFITNNHVIADADEISIVLLDDTEIPAVLVGTDDGIDLALLKIDQPIDAVPVPLGDSDALEIGELAIAIGDPGASSNVLRGSVTAGIISALDRENISGGNFSRPVKVIQTDAAINSGNSGGALLNAKGELIGMPTLKYIFGSTSPLEGLGFAVPINTIKPVLEQLIDTGRMVRPRLGVLVVDLDGPDRPLKKYAPAGIQVVEVEPNGPAAAAGLMNLDIITEVDGQRVTTTSQLTGAIDEHQPGDSLKLTICRFYDAVTGEPLATYQMLETEVPLAIID